jgi:hypothetical protein
VKPVSYYHDALCFAVATGFKAIVALARKSRRLNEACLADCLLVGF